MSDFFEAIGAVVLGLLAIALVVVCVAVIPFACKAGDLLEDCPVEGCLDGKVKCDTCHGDGYVPREQKPAAPPQS